MKNYFIEILILFLMGITFLKAQDIQVGISSGSNFYGSTSWRNWDLNYEIYIADINGDGKADFIGRNRRTSMIKVGISNGNGFSISSGSWNENYWDLNYDIHIADVNGDGMADIIGRSEIDGDIQVGISSGSNFYGSTSWRNWDLNYEIYIADINGDGKADFIGRNRRTSMIKVGISNGNGFSISSGSWNENYWDLNYDIHIADVNGDGMADIIGRSEIDGDIQVGISSGSNFYGSTSWGNWDLNYDIHIADVNGDGKADFIGRNRRTSMIKVGISNGNGLSTSRGSWNENYWDLNYDIHIADVNGDGMADIIGRK